MKTPTTRSSDQSGSQNVKHSLYDLQYLRRQCRWIRDDLDPQIARRGPDALHSDDVLKLDEFLRRLLDSNLSLEDIRHSRLHLAIESISGKATRWPKKVIERADAVRAIWEARYGPLKEIGILLYEPGGRLHEIAPYEDKRDERMVDHWVRSPAVRLNPLSARRPGDLGFRPGDWWINTLFALRAGITDTADAAGRIVADGIRAYAVLMNYEDEIDSPSSDAFTYRANNSDRGRYRLTAATPEARQPVRILRSHSLRSFWAPKAGVRYDGLHIVVGWSIKTDTKTEQITYHIDFKRIGDQLPMEQVLRRPFVDEVEDYKEYKRIRQGIHEAHSHTPRRIRGVENPIIVGPSDGTAEVEVFDETEDMDRMDVRSVSDPEE